VMSNPALERTPGLRFSVVRTPLHRRLSALRSVCRLVRDT
jgi:hypothetical protein